MLGRWVDDPDGVDGKPGRAEGLGLLDVKTVMAGDKRVRQTVARTQGGALELSGYEIHMGRTEGPDCDRAWLEVEGRAEGAQSEDGRVRGTYLHGLFESDAFRADFLSKLGVNSSGSYDSSVETALDDLAEHLERYMDLDQLLALAGPVSPPSAI